MSGAEYRDPLLINTVGHAAGLLLFGVLAGLFRKDWRHSGERQTRLSFAAAVLALLWNGGALLVLALSESEPRMVGLVVACSFSALSVLPAVLLNVVMRGRSRLVVAGAYGVSSIAVVLHLSEWAISSSNAHQFALLTIAFGFPLLIAGLAAFQFRLHGLAFARTPELLALASLVLFTLSFLHFGYGHGALAWTAEVAWHHAGIPLALFVLLQDYRFLLLDVYFRFLLNFGLAALYAVAGLLLYKNVRFRPDSASAPVVLGLAFVASCLGLISFGVVRARLQHALTLRLFRRNSLSECSARLSGAASRAASEPELLEECAGAFADCLAAQRFGIRPIDSFDTERAVIVDEAGKRLHFPDSPWVEVAVPLRLAHGTRYFVALGARGGGRPYLSEDLEALTRLAASASEQLERFRSDALRQLVKEAELRALQSQINPHFLFNALNTLYGTIDRRSQQARRFVLNLADIFRYFLQTDRTYILLAEELNIVRAYLEIEKLRLGDRLETSICVPDNLMHIPIPVLSVQPLVENAVKHGVAALAKKGVVIVSAKEMSDGLRIAVEDSGRGFEKNESRSGTGVGLENVRMRLQLCYGEAAQLTVARRNSGTEVSFIVPAKASLNRNWKERSLPGPVQCLRQAGPLAKR